MKIENRIERMRTGRRGVNPEELDAILVALGFSRRPGKGDHRVYSHPKLHDTLGIDPRRPLLPIYVTKALRAIEEVLTE